MKILASYKNGDYVTTLYDDGTKISLGFNIYDVYKMERKYAFAENIDIKLTDTCSANCAFCHENSTEHGKSGNLYHPFFNTLHKGQEVALGGGNIFDIEHFELLKLLYRLQHNGIIVNITVNQIHFIQNFEFIKELKEKKLIYGIGISISPCVLPKTLELIKEIPNVVLHAINGILTIEEFVKLYDKDISLLILGYKELRRGENYKNANSAQIAQNIDDIKQVVFNSKSKFKSISFDNLAIEQLNVKANVDEKTWKIHYMGDDGTKTFYIDLVNEEFAMSSTSKERYPMGNDCDEMFRTIRDKKIS